MAKKRVSIDIVSELEKNYQNLQEVSDTIKSKIQSLLQKENSRSFRQLVLEKEISQLLSGFASIERLKIDVLKQLKEIEEKTADDTTNDLKTMLLKLVQRNETSS